jgi:hypothetical protein
MENSYQTNEVLDQHRPKELPGTLNTLTILTFIGCGFSYIFALLIYVFTNNASDKIEKMSEAGASQKQIDEFLKAADNRGLLLITGIIFTTLCLIGAIQMRKLKKTGYYLYLLGELAPFIVSAGLIGLTVDTSSIRAIIGLIIGTAIPVVFVILYSTQLKHLS